MKEFIGLKTKTFKNSYSTDNNDEDKKIEDYKTVQKQVENKIKHLKNEIDVYSL